MAEKNKIIVLEPCTKSVEDLLASIEAKGQVEVLRVQSPEEADQLVKQNQPCMLVLCVQDNSEVPPRVNMLKKLESVIKKGLLKSFVTSKLKNRQLGTLITSLGVTDFIEEPAPVRTMQFKANLQLKAVETIRKQEEMKKASQEKIVFKKSEAKKGEDAATGQDAAAKSKPALQLQEDAFLFKNSGAKKLGKKMVVELEGPDPSTGEWVQHEDKGNAQTSWRWVPKDEKEAAAQGAGNGWVHEGEKPEFKEQSGKWQFTSEKPDLSFRKNGEKIASKLATDENGELVVAEDSPTALANVEKNKALAKRIREKKAAAFGDGSDPAEAEAAAESERTLKGAASNAAAEAARKLGSLPEAAPEEAAAFNNHTGGKKDGPEGTFSDQSGAGSQGPGGTIGQKVAAGEGEEPGAPLSPLEFLKKKKKAKAKQLKDLGELPEAPAEEAATEKLDAAPKAEAESESEEGSEIERAARAPKKKKKSAADAAQEMLARMKSKLGDSPAAEEPTEARAAASEEPPPEAPAEEADPLERRRKGKGEDNAQAPAADAPSEEGEDPVARERMERRKKERKEKKRDLLKEVQDIMAEPLPESLPFEEAAALRKKLGLEDQPELSDRDLARKDRLEKVKKIKERLLEIDQLPFAEEETPAAKVHDLKFQDPENTWSESDSNGGGAPERKLRAFDSEEAPAAEEDEETLRKRRREEARGERAPAEDRYVYLPAAEIQPAGNAWEKAGEEYYVYLDSQVRYRGFEKIEDTLPLWIFRGERVPELLDKTQQWRFLDRPPVKATSAGELPRDVRDFLLELRDRVKKEKSERPEEPSEAARGEAPADQAEGLKEKFEKKKKNEAQDRLDRLKDQLADDPLAERGSPAEADGAQKEREEELSEAAKAEKRQRQEEEESTSEARSETREEEAASQESESERARAEENSAEAGATAEEKSEKKSDAFQSRLDALRSRVGQGEDSLSEEGTKTEEEKAAAQESTADETSKALPPDPGPLSMADVSTKPSVKAFLERRKSKSKESKERPPVAPARDPYLGIYVAVSNALGHVGDQKKSLLRVLSAIEGSFERCAAAVLEAPGPDGQCPIRSAHPGRFSENQPVNLTTGLAFPIQREDGAGEQILGYLFLKPLADRESFADDEQRAATKVARALWAVLSAAAAGSDGERRAA